MNAPTARTEPLTPASSPLSSVMDSPDLISATFLARDSLTGATSANFGVKFRYYPIYKITIYDYATQVPFRSDLGLNHMDPINLSGTIVAWRPGGYLSYSYSTTGAGPVTLIEPFGPSDSLGVVTRTGAGGVGALTGQKPGEPPWFCGRQGGHAA